MILLSYILFLLGIVSYAISLFFIKSPLGEIFSDAGNALVLITCALLLFRMVKSNKIDI